MLANAATILLVKIKQPPLVTLLLLLLSGCYVRLPVSEAVAEPLAPAKVKALAELGERPSTAGEWFEVRVLLPRESVRKIARWELYTHMLVENCRTGDVVGIASSTQIEGTDGNFRAIREQLRADRRRAVFIMSESMFFPAGQPLDGLCLQLDGGSYTLQKISNRPVPLKVRRVNT